MSHRCRSHFGTELPNSHRSRADFCAQRLNPGALDTDNPDMGTRYCRSCATEVEDAGGYCLLGHPLRLEAPRDSLAHLRAEVDRAFEDAKMEVATALSAIPANKASGSEVALPPSPPRRPVFETIDQPTGGPDPLVEFAPAPRMDWGPEKNFFKRR